MEAGEGYSWEEVEVGFYFLEVGEFSGVGWVFFSEGRWVFFSRGS